MALKAKEKTKVIAEFRQHTKDTGSSEVQVALLTKEIDRLTKHLKQNPKDVHSRRGLLGMVAQRRKLLDFLKDDNTRSYNRVTKKLGLKS